MLPNAHRVLVVAVALGSLVDGLAAQDWRRVLPPGQSFHAMAYDLLRGRLVLLGDGTWELEGARWTHVPTASSPPPTTMTLVFDAARARMVFFGGDPRGTPETWEYDGVNWMRATPPVMPPPRANHALAFDLLRGRTVLFGGRTAAFGFLADTWEYDGLNWQQMATPASPPARCDHALAFDLARGRAVLFGGLGATTFLDDTWEYDGVNWVQRSPSTRPPGRSVLGLAYDLLRNRTVLFGGSGAGTTFGDTWEYDGTNWTQAVPATAPSPRWGHALAYDPGRQRVVCNGGYPQGSARFADTWEYDGVTWTQTPTPASPPPLQAPALAFDGARQQVVLFGGYTRPGFAADTWEYDGRWTRRATAHAPSARGGHVLTYDPGRGRVVLFGGTTSMVASGSLTLSDTWEYDGVDWTRVATANSPPARMQSALVHDSVRARTVLVGGNTGGGPLTLLNDTWEYDGNNWTQSAATIAPGGLCQHALAFDTARARTVLFGGTTVVAGWSTAFAGTWEYDGSVWVQVPTAAAPPLDGRLAYDCARGRTVMLTRVPVAPVPASFRDTWEYDGSNWAALSPASSLGGRDGEDLAYDGARGVVVLFGGLVPWQGDTAELVPPTSATWTRHGTGCAGSAGVPALDAAPGALPSLGTSFALQQTAMPSQPGAALLVFGLGLAQWNGRALPIALDAAGLPGCRLWLAPAAGASLLLAHAGNAASFAFAIPAQPALAGLVAGVQAFVLDAAAPSGLGAASNGGVLRVF